MAEIEMKRIYRIIVIAFLLALVPAAWIFAFETRSHMDDMTNPDECMACHRGRGVSGTALLMDKRENLCFRCHGSEAVRRRDRARADIETVLLKVSVHPVIDTSEYHRMKETLPETDPNAPRHVACQDCHRVHISTDMAPTKGSKGYAPGDMRREVGTQRPLRGIRLRQASTEYEICYLCHSESANLDPQKNVAADFNPLNASYHPVEMTGKNKTVPSLIGGMSENSRIGCGSCHGNDDPSGPKGPHGSEFKPLLIAQYNIDDGPEMSEAYELCYICHRRSSIMANDSFKSHEQHIVLYEASCHTCHSAHGSDTNPNLIRFNESVVSVSNTTMLIEYLPGPGGMPRCYLNCHDTDHSTTGVANTAWPW